MNSKFSNLIFLLKIPVNLLDCKFKIPEQREHEILDGIKVIDGC